MNLLDDKNFKYVTQNLHESKMSANNLNNYLLFYIISLLNLFCTFEPSFIR